VPREVYAIWDAGLAARIAGLRRARGDAPAIARRIHRVFGRAESQLSEALRGMVDGVPGASLHYQVKFPETLIKLVVRDPDAAAAAARLAALDEALEARVGAWRYATGDDALPLIAGRALLAAGVRVATAESCTGGMVGSLLTELAGSSGYYVGGAVTYSDEEKVRQLGVAPETLAAHGAVSEPTVIEMARGIRARTGADLAIAISGVAGPGGGSAEKPVGTVWLALDGAGEASTFRMQWPGARDQVRVLAAWWALDMLRRAALASRPNVKEQG
jgi:nicotinamide-nucleotide amidase